LCVFQENSDGVLLLMVYTLFFLLIFEKCCLRFCACNFLDFVMLVITDTALHLVRNNNFHHILLILIMLKMLDITVFNTYKDCNFV
jgi:hypothetical protein